MRLFVNLVLLPHQCEGGWTLEAFLSIFSQSVEDFALDSKFFGAVYIFIVCFGEKVVYKMIIEFRVDLIKVPGEANY